MYGWRARIGLMTPSVNTTTEPEFSRNLPDGVSLHTARVPLTGGTTAGIERMRAGIDRCAELLADASVDVVALGCTSGTFFEEERIESRISEPTGVPAVATAASLKRAFDALGIESVTISTPYTDELNDLEVEFMEESGYDVVAIDGLGIEDGLRMGRASPESVYRQAVETSCPTADAHVISCANYRTFEVVGAIEADIGKPVLTSNGVVLWDALRTVGIGDGLDLGTLFEH